MNVRCIFVLSGLVLSLAGLTGLSSAAPADQVVARVHWLGLDRVSADTNSAHFMKVWRSPETATLLAQTLDKFSRWPGNGATNAASARLRPLLNDLVTSESYWELRLTTNSRSSASGSQILLAVRLPAGRARLWQTNLAAAVESLTGTRPVPDHNGWVLRHTPAPERIEFSRIDKWTLVGWGPATNDLLATFAARIIGGHASRPNLWLEADLNPLRLFPGLEIINPQLATLHRLHLTVRGGKGNVLTRATFDFSHPLDLPLSPWELPTNFIRGPIISFTAVRGFAPGLASQAFWQKTGLGRPPNQAFFWAQEGTPVQTYFIAPEPAASNQLSRLAAHLVPDNSWLATNAQGYFQWTNHPPQLTWKNALIISPYLVPVTLNHRDYVLGGLYPLARGNPNPLPAEILRTVLGTTNLVYYQTEVTGERVGEDLFIGQLFRVVFHKAQLPPASAALVWLKQIEPLLGTCTTLVTQTRPDQLAFTRESTIGFTALELHLLGDWLESPRFPHGLHTFLAPLGKGFH